MQKKSYLPDLLSDKHLLLRQKVRMLWQQSGREDVTLAESHLLSLLEQQPETIAGAARKMNISRQAVHRCAKGLIEKKYIDDKTIQKNERDKVLVLTDKGSAFCREIIEVKQQVEEEIAEKIGHENVIWLKKLLEENWDNKIM
ncbi:MarR family transcriptional regulator [Domibacillus sp.]|uniref:MarR family winged helix-turn-helix transcriptional regulator n=1 Tax=Domibacillus sp. TaxID=1969783 RepID=UPI0028113135|nr:MarR family transcriptional regulator [Domibacillus sp.]